MKSKIFNAIVCASMIAGLTACGDVEDLVQLSTNIPMPLNVGSCEDAKHLDEARAWSVNAPGTPFENIGRIELTASGNYMFLPETDSFSFEDSEGDMFEAPRHKSFRKNKRKDTRNIGNYPVGTFTKISDSEYDLSSLGRLTVNADGSLTLNTGQTEYSFNATPVSAYQLDELTRRFSHTWEVVQVERAYYDSDGKFVKKRFLSQAEIEEEYIRAMVVTQYGAFVRYDWDSTLDGYGIWKWELPEKQLFQFVFSDDIYGYYPDTGYEQVYFYNEFAMFIEFDEEYSTDDSGEYYTIADVLKTRSIDGLKL